MQSAKAAPCFSDLANFDASLSQSICALKEQDLVHGFPDGKFNPNWLVSKGEFAKLAVLSPLQEVLAADEEALAEIETGDIDTILTKAVAAGLLDLELADFDPTERIRRLEAVDYIISAYGIDYSEKGTLGHPFNDVSSLNDFDQKVAYLYYEGVIKGYSDNSFGPANYLTRAEAAKIAYLARDLLSRVEVGEEEEEVFEADDTEVQVAGYQLEIVEIAPRDLMAGETMSILVSVTSSRRGNPVTGLDSSDLHASVVKGRATIRELTELGDGLYMLTVDIDDDAAPGPLRVDIVLLRGKAVRVSTSDFFANLEVAGEEEVNSLVRVIPSDISSGDTATIIATPQDFHGDPVSGLELEASVIKGSGRIISQMEEVPAGTGVYVGTFLADTIASNVVIAVRITNTATRPEAQVAVTVH